MYGVHISRYPVVHAELMKMAIGHRAEEGYVLRDFVSPEEEEEDEEACAYPPAKQPRYACRL